MDRQKIARLLEEMALCLELSGASKFKSRAYSAAARTILKSELSDGELADPKKLRTLKGIGPSLAEAVEEALGTGRLSSLEELKNSLPQGLSQLVKVPGLGPKRVHRLYTELGVTSLGELAYACHENRLAALAGFGPSVQAKVLEGLSFLKRYQEFFLYPDVWSISLELAEFLRRSDLVLEAVPAGPARRRMEIAERAVVVACSTAPSAVLTHFSSWIKGAEFEPKAPNRAGVLHPSGPWVEVMVACPKLFGLALVWATGSEAHLERLRERARERGLRLTPEGLLEGERSLEVPGEESFYAYLGLDLIPPELREGRGEVEAAARGELPEPLGMEDLKGVFHVHTTASDGANSLAEMAARAREMGLAYLGLSDHSRSAFYAGGLSEEDLLRQAGEVERINARGQGFRVFHGVESDIRADGSLDYPDEVLGRLDFVIASVHGGFNLERTRQTERLIKAVSHPATTILGHPTGRLLLAREAYQVDLEAVIRACAGEGVALEINSNPHRADTDWRVASEARKLGVKFVICPDAHDLEGLGDLEPGLGLARKAWLTKDDLLNCLDPEQMAAYLRAGKDRGR